VEGVPLALRVRVANTELPDEVNLWLRAAGSRNFRKPLAMRREHGNDYLAVVPRELIPAGLYEYVVSTRTGERVTSFPGGAPQQPGEWPFRAEAPWSFLVTPAGTPLRLLDPKNDYARLSFVRPGETYRTPFFRVAPGEASDEAALRLELPDLGPDTPERYAAALYIGDRIGAHRGDAPAARTLEIKLRAVGGTRKSLEVTLIEQDGSAWSTTVVGSGAWSTVIVPLDQLRLSRSIHIPSPFPGLWNYWRESPARRAGDRIRVADVERLQLTVEPNTRERAAADAPAVAVESIRLTFAGAH
jgi:hypothetical protein